MNMFRIKFAPKTDLEFDDDLLELIWDYLSCLYKNGQILIEYELINIDNHLCAFVTLPEDDALNQENNNIYVTKYLKKVKEKFDLSIEMIGKNMNQGESCSCKESTWYMLYTDWTLTGSPVVCGDCGKTFPLYRLPHIMDKEEHFEVVGWQKVYKSVDILFMYGLSDRFTFRQMHNPKSQLSEDGMEICKALEEKTGKPFYYYLFNYNRISKTCPICGSHWKIKGEKTFVNYKCERCRLAADRIYH